MPIQGSGELGYEDFQARLSALKEIRSRREVNVSSVYRFGRTIPRAAYDSWLGCKKSCTESGLLSCWLLEEQEEVVLVQCRWVSPLPGVTEQDVRSTLRGAKVAGAAPGTAFPADYEIRSKVTETLTLERQRGESVVLTVSVGGQDEMLTVPAWPSEGTLTLVGGQLAADFTGTKKIEQVHDFAGESSSPMLIKVNGRLLPEGYPGLKFCLPRSSVIEDYAVLGGRRQGRSGRLNVHAALEKNLRCLQVWSCQPVKRGGLAVERVTLRGARTLGPFAGPPQPLTQGGTLRLPYVVPYDQALLPDDLDSPTPVEGSWRWKVEIRHTTAEGQATLKLNHQQPTDGPLTSFMVGNALVIDKAE